MGDPFADLPKGHFGAILADPPWKFERWYERNIMPGRETERHYGTMPTEDIKSMPVKHLAAKNCVLFIWITWPMLKYSLEVVTEWGFEYKTCAFSWMKAKNTQIDLYDDELKADMTCGYWTRANSEVCLLATRGKPKRLDAGVRQGIIAPRREHSRKPDGIHERIERLVAGPYLELFARQSRPGWTVWGNETNKFDKQTVAAE